MAIAPYDASAGGPSSAATLDTMQAADNMQTTFERGQKTQKLGQLNIQQQDFSRPALESSLGATGQYNSGAANTARSEQNFQFDSQRADISSAFARTQMEMKRNEIFAGMGLILG
jgi:hypothetical protein